MGNRLKSTTTTAPPARQARRRQFGEDGRTLGTAGHALVVSALALVFGAAMLNYMDRQALALLKPQLEVQFGWSDSDYAHINSGFQLATIASMLAVGWFVDRVGLRAGYAIGVGGWSIAQMSHVLVTTVAGFFTTRVALAA